jgi:hypothetical protein
LARLLRQSRVEGGRNVQLPPLVGLIPMALYIALATTEVAKMRGTPELKMALKNAAPELDMASEGWLVLMRSEVLVSPWREKLCWAALK